MVVVLLAATGGAVMLGSAVIARHRAQAAADLSALAGAGQLTAGPDTACMQARRLAARMRAVEMRCAVEGLDIVVIVEVALPGWRPALVGPARATARAGPSG